MSNNAAVTADGGEIGRAQALQARACGVEPTVHMNPVLLKPQSETGAQVVVHGRVIGNARARDYQARKRTLLAAVLDSHARLEAEADLVLVEGAGSAAEINLREGDIANMGFARAASCPVVLVADIDRGGVFAQVLGTQTALAPEDAATIVGLRRQQVPRRREPLRRRHADDRRADRLARLRPRALFRGGRGAAGRGRFRPPRRSARAKARVTIAVPMLCRASPISTTSTR